ncbi:MAG TPA: aminotransferase class III-fold pyridoxal phosphate-dependent enzyme [Thermomicrobiales bacterium]|nr:aminotransferase class III-fold pyridoxal phosphate-dependent enzyme [Thermomicrobiales bacterium]
MADTTSTHRPTEELLADADSIFPGRSSGSYAVPAWMQDVVFDHGEGSRLYTTEGDAYLDYILGSGPLILGHAHPHVVAAVQEQAPRGSTFYALNEPVIRLGRMIVDAAPCAERVMFASTGAEATYLALRLARGFTGRDYVLRFAGGYHGHHDYASTQSAGVPRATAATVLTATFNDLASVEAQFAAHPSEIAAVIVEPLHRVVQPEPGFLAELARMTREAGALLIFDEVVTGFRLAWGGGQEFYGVTPDLATYGKIIGGGYPVSAICGRSDVMDQADPRRGGQAGYVFISGTLSGNPIGAAAGLATLTELAQPGAHERLNHAGERLRAGFNVAAEEFDLPLEMLGEGAVNGVVTKTDGGNAPDTATALLPRLGRALFERGIASNLGKVYVSLAHSDADLDETVRGYVEALDQVKRELTR